MIPRIQEYALPVDYTKLTPYERKLVRLKYMAQQQGNCFYCKCSLIQEPPKHILAKPINWALFPPGFLNHKVHLQHSHETGMTEGAVHAYCNAIMWQYDKK